VKTGRSFHVSYEGFLVQQDRDILGAGECVGDDLGPRITSCYPNEEKGRTVASLWVRLAEI
jgi:hypothetical protein